MKWSVSMGTGVRTTTCRVTAMRDCLISAFTAWVHLVLMGSPARSPSHELERL